MKKSCVFIDHKYHIKTKSTIFLRNILEQRFELSDYWIDDFSASTFQELLDSTYDLYIVFQYDFIATFLLSHNKNVVSIPMYDGTGAIHPSHWIVQFDALFINFSKTIHKLHTSLGLKSVHQLFFPQQTDVETASPVAFDELRLFFWERKPSSGLSVDWLAERINGLSNKPSYIHIHLSPDPGEHPSVHSSRIKELFPYAKTSVSTWFESKSKFLEVLHKHNLFVCSRISEGIGFSFLEAMAAGMATIGLNHPTYNEYVLNRKTGILLNTLDSPFPELDIHELELIGSAALNAVEQGRKQWEVFEETLLHQIELYMNHRPSGRSKIPMSPCQAERMSFLFFEDPISYVYFINKEARKALKSSSDNLSNVNLINHALNLPYPHKISYMLRNSPMLKALARTAYEKSRK